MVVCDLSKPVIASSLLMLLQVLLSLLNSRLLCRRCRRKRCRRRGMKLKCRLCGLCRSEHYRHDWRKSTRFLRDVQGRSD